MVDIALIALWIGGWVTLLIMLSDSDRFPYPIRVGGVMAGIVFAWAGGWKLFT